MISNEDIITLQLAEELRTAAEEAPAILLEAAVAMAANTAANSGEKSVTWIGKLTPELKTKLEDDYNWTVTPRKPSSDSNDAPTVWDFSWK